MALSKIQPASIDLTANYAFTGTNSIPSASSGTYEEKKLATQTASSSGTLQFTSSIDSTYNIYKFRFVNIHAGTNNTYLTFNGRDGGTDYDATKTTTVFESYHNEGDSEAAVSYSSSLDIAQGTGFQQISANIGDGNDESASGELFLFNPSSTTFVKHFISTVQGYNHSNYSEIKYVAGYFNVTAAIDAIQFKMSSGNIDSGTIEMYGIN